VIVDCAVYEEGARREGGLPLHRAGHACRKDGAFVWLGVVHPPQEEFDAIAQEFELHELAVEDAVNAHQRPKLEVYGDTLFVVLKTARYVEELEDVEIGEVQLFVNESFVITVRHGETAALKEVRKRVERRSDLLLSGPAAVLYAIVDRVVDDYELVAHGVDTDIQEVEAQVFSPDRENPGERIYKLEREVLDFQRAVAPLAPVVDKLARGHFELIDPELHHYFRDVHDHLLRVSAQIGTFRDLLSSALQANLTQASVRQNEDMRKISAWVAILAVPTLVAGIYGMNFQHMPELGWSFGYPLVIGLIVVACTVLYLRFRRSGWL
jgi:magnesium transporter